MVDAVYRAESRRVLSTLIRLLGDFDLAEEALQDVFVSIWQRAGQYRAERGGAGQRMRLVRVADVEPALASDRIDQGGGREKGGQRHVTAAQALREYREVGPRPIPVIGGQEMPAAPQIGRAHV